MNMADTPPSNIYESIAPSLIVYSVICQVVILTVVASRFYIRLRILRKFGADDMALAATLFSTIGGVIGIGIACRLGLGRHIEALSKEDRSGLYKLLFVSALGYHVSLMMLKSTFLLQYRRVFPLPNFQRLCDIFLAFLGVWTVAGLVGGATVCLPVSKNWDLKDPIWSCEERYSFWLAYGILHLITDLLIFIMPLPLLKTLPLPPLHKFVLFGVFCLGFVTCIISGLRLPSLYGSLRDPDTSYTSTKTMYWSLGEVTCSIVCLCIPTLRPLLGHCCAHRLGEGNIMGRGSRRFGIYAISLPSTVGSPYPLPRQTEDPIPINERA